MMHMLENLFTLCLLSTSFTITLPAPTQVPNYKEALRLSLLFYEAQRSGHLPKDNRIPWRGDSALNDSGTNGEDLSGGYYDASDNIKFSFTMAFTTTMLSWGLMSYDDAYKEAGQHVKVLQAIKWASDYFVKCHVSENEFYGQVGDFSTDLKYWGRPEDLNLTRPAYKIDTTHPGTDLAGEASAALAATSIVFQEINDTYSKEILKHAIQLFEFADKYRGLYQEVIPGAKSYYENAGYGDELTWAAVWLYKATKTKKYLRMAETFYETFRLKERPNEFFYNKKVAGVQVLLAQETRDSHYMEAVKSFCEYSVLEQIKTPKGLIFIEKMGTLSHAANIAFICLQAADININTPKYVQFARDQVNYMLGSGGPSYLVGYGNNYPKRPHHSASSCPNIPEPCGWKHYTSQEPNPQLLNGALVSGPDKNDHYEDRREEFLYNDVTLDYNAGFQGALAGLIHCQLNGL